MLKRNRGHRGPHSGRQKTDPAEQALELQELARRQLARNLHDAHIQSVAALAMHAHLAKRLLGKDLPAATEEIANLEDLARRTTKELRHLQFILRPQSLETRGLAAALQDLAAQEKELYGQSVQFEPEAKAAKGLGLHDSQLLFQIAAEAVVNARRHAQCNTITLKLTRPERGVLLLEIQDDGSGFDLSAIQTKPEEERGLGIVLMRIRAKLLGGELGIDTQKGRGTTVRVAAPMK